MAGASTPAAYAAGYPGNVALCVSAGNLDFRQVIMLAPIGQAGGGGKVGGGSWLRGFNLRDAASVKAG